jgi:hypothetical protein
MVWWLAAVRAQPRAYASCARLQPPVSWTQASKSKEMLHNLLFAHLALFFAVLQARHSTRSEASFLGKKKNKSVRSEVIQMKAARLAL